MQQTTVLIKDIWEKNKRAFYSFELFLKKEKAFGITENILSQQVKDILCEVSFKELCGIIYYFFDNKNMILAVMPYDFHTAKDTTTCKWKFLINIDNTDIIEGDFDKREYAEFIMFKKAFQFLDTTLFIKDTQNRYIDESADSSCLNVNWKHLSTVLNYKRKFNS